MARNLRDQVIIITGGGTGIGAATARAAAAEGMHVVLNGRRADKLEEVAEEVRKFGRKTLVVPGDVAAAGVNDELLQRTTRELGGYYAVFASAGYGYFQPMHTQNESAMRRIFEVNFFAACELITQAARELIAGGKQGHLLMCSSALARFTLPCMGAYSATKAAQHHICRAMRMELRQYGIEVSSVHPVTTLTEFFDVEPKYTETAGTFRPKKRGIAVGPKPQPPSTVATAVLRCLKYPRPEVWTSRMARYGAAIMTIAPRFMDFIGAQAMPDRDDSAER
jgi:short-subunit dehydrogenase